MLPYMLPYMLPKTEMCCIDKMLSSLIFRFVDNIGQLKTTEYTYVYIY